MPLSKCHSRVRVCLLLGALQAAIGCSDATAVVATYRTPTSGSGGHPQGGSSGASAAMGGDDAGQSMTAGAGRGEIHEETIRVATGSRDQFCAGHGPALDSYGETTGGGSEPACTAGIGRRLFPYALCSCSDLTLGGAIATIDAFDSRQGAYTMAEGAGPIGINRSLSDVATVTSHFGTAIVAGSGFLVTGPMDIAGDAKSNAAINVSGISIAFDRDLWVNADIHGSVTTKVTRDLHQTAGYTGADTLNRIAGTNTSRQDVTVTPPCPCHDSALLDIAGIVTSAQTNNDNAQLGVSAAALADMLGSGSAPAGFTCGRYALSSVSIGADFSSAISGRMALFVDGSLTLSSDFAASLAPGAELDVFVTGDLRLSGPGRIGTQARPAALRLYIGGSAPLNISDANPLAVQLYAPRAPIVIPTSVLVAVYGSIFAARIETQSAYFMHYDRSIIDTGEECSGAVPTPAKLLSADACHACPRGLADIGGVCGPCTGDADCCDPLVCVSGSCQSLIVMQ
jgi:hypothetical protein